jgi:ferrous iron transport protein B
MTTTPLIVALAGNPNCGKTSVFNALTGLKQKVANYPGITVERKTGRCRLPDGRDAEIIDLPGTYSLIANSPDEQVAMEVLRGLRSDTPVPDVVVVVVDASNLARNLYLVSQLLELGRPLVVALNMMDIAERRGQAIDVAQLAAELGVAVCPVVAHKRRGFDGLLKAVVAARPAQVPAIPLPAALHDAIEELSQRLESSSVPAATARSTARRLLLGDGAHDLDRLRHDEPLQARLLGLLHRLETANCEAMQADIESRYRWIDALVARTVSAASPAAGARTLTDRVDAVLVHRFWGLGIFATIMATLFVSIFWLANPVMDGIQSGLAWLGDLVTAHMGEGAVKALVNDGIISGVGSVVVFVPQIALLFLFLSVLEDSGYLARAAFLMDRLLAKTGLHGKSFIPLLSSFACAIPGIMATRTIDAWRERLATILVAPFMSCSARLPVYLLLIQSFFGDYHPAVQGSIMLSCYLLGIAMAALVAWLGKRLRGGDASASFILEMPTYKIPQVAEVTRQVWTNTVTFLTRAGTTIFFLCVLLWALTYFPRLPDERVSALRQQADISNAAPSATASDHAVAAAQLEYSYAGRLGHLLEPAVAPLGYDWKMAVGLVGAFAAREVFVSTMGIIYAAGDDTSDLQARMRADRRDDGTPLWTPLVAISLLTWFVLAMQCLSTVVIVRRETNGWTWPLIQLAGMNLIAWLAACAVYQGGRAMGF